MNQEIVKELKIEFNSKELILMSNLYLSPDYPHNFLTMGQISKKLNISKATVINITKELVKKGCLTKEKSSVTFYYPVVDKNIKRLVLSKLGFFIE